MIMKTSKILVASIATVAIFGLMFSSTSAAYGQGGGQGNGMHTSQGQGKWQGQGQRSGEATQRGHEKDPSDMLVGVPLQDLSEAEQEMLYYGYSEELLAHDMYLYFYELYGTPTFKNIADSEQEHMTAVKALLDRYELDIPTDYGELTDEFVALKAEGEESVLKALEVGVKIELLDIEDIAQTIRTTDNDDFRIIFTNIGWASYNHLRGFLSAINNAGLETEIDYSDYITDEEVATKGGSLKSKMAEKLEAEGMVLPEKASTKYIQENCTDEGSEWGAQNTGKAQSWKGNNGQQGQNQSAMNGNSNSVLKNQYKVSYDAKYGVALAKLDDAKLNTLIERIDALAEKVQAGNYATTTKQKYSAMLWALRELAVENLDTEELDIEWLFE